MEKVITIKTTIIYLERIHDLMCGPFGGINGQLT